MNNEVFGTTIQNLGKHRKMKLETTVKRKASLTSEANYYPTKFFQNIY